jgi:poly(U)-specific endoribonuclease
MRLLFNNYEVDSSVNEYVTPNEHKEENDFLDEVMKTSVMRAAMQFLQEKNQVTPDPKTHRDLVKTIWFNLYSRGQGKIGSSGFEHVFVTEIKNGTVIGMHNWLYFYEEEKAGKVDYKGYSRKLDLGNVSDLNTFSNSPIFLFFLNKISERINCENPLRLMQGSLHN